MSAVNWSVIAAILAMPVGIAWGSSVTFQLVPGDGIISGTPGSTIGWGYFISNQSPTSWLVTTALNADPFIFGSPASLFDFPDLAPNTDAQEDFDPVLGIGLYQLTWDLTAPVDFANFGTFTLSTEWWSGNPTAGGVFLESGPDISQPYFATVDQASSVPEPNTAASLLVGATLVLLVWRARLRRGLNARR